MDLSHPHPDLGRVLPTPMLQQVRARAATRPDTLQLPAEGRPPDFLADVRHEDWGRPGDAAFQADVVQRLADRVRDVFAQAPRRSQAVHRPDPLQAQSVLDDDDTRWSPAKATGKGLLASLPAKEPKA